MLSKSLDLGWAVGVGTRTCAQARHSLGHTEVAPAGCPDCVGPVQGLCRMAEGRGRGGGVGSLWEWTMGLAVHRSGPEHVELRTESFVTSGQTNVGARAGSPPAGVPGAERGPWGQVTNCHFHSVLSTSSWWEHGAARIVVQRAAGSAHLHGVTATDQTPALGLHGNWRALGRVFSDSSLTSACVLVTWSVRSWLSNRPLEAPGTSSGPGGWRT